MSKLLRLVKQYFNVCSKALWNGKSLLTAWVALSCSLSASAGTTVFDVGDVEANYPTLKQVRYSFSVQNTKNTVLNTCDLWVCAPTKITSAQKCTRIETTHPAELVVDSLGNQILHFNLKDIAPYGLVIVTVKASVQQTDEPVTFKSFTQPFIVAEPFIESDHQDIVAQASRLKREDSSSTTRAVYRWLIENVDYQGPYRNNRGALYAFQHRQGDCTEYASLFAALCRACNIPARVVGGYVCRGNEVLKPDGYHNWAEYYDGRRWVVVDPIDPEFDVRQSDYLAFSLVAGSEEGPVGRGKRFAFTGDGLKVRMID